MAIPQLTITNARAAVGAGIALTLAAMGSGPAESDAGRRAGASTEVRLDGGRIRGVADGDVLRWRGIRYAQPPLGELRWRPPRPVPPWKGVRSASTSLRPCAQTSSNPKEVSRNEDCLGVDVTAPARPARGPRPVMVWLHGGGFTAGSGSEYDPRRLAVQGDVVVVTVDFRLGTLGYMSLPEMTDGGSYGLQDQQAALRWVRRNAAAFGGDPANVTLFGESGGGIATCGHLTSPGSRTLFTKAILQSGACGTKLLVNAAAPGAPELPFWRPQARSVAATRAAAARLGCGGTGTLACLRRVPVDRLLGETDHVAAAAVGGATLPADPARVLESGKAARVPVLSGHTRDEALMFAGVHDLLGEPITDADLDGLLRQAFGARAAEVERRYPRRSYPTAAQAWAAPHTDAIFACPHAAADRALARHAPVYAYEFADRTAPPLMPSRPGFPAGASHGSELAYLFEVKDKPIDISGRPLPLTGPQKRIAAEMVAAWTAFARTGTPASGGAPWPAWTAADPKVKVIGGTGRIDRPCGMW
jgi:para-nitrobenzyl esterase